jgi:hypothetical protein
MRRVRTAASARTATTPVRRSLASITWKSSSTKTTSEPIEPSSFARVVMTVSMGGGCASSMIATVWLAAGTARLN